MANATGGTLFGAIVSLSGPSALPSGSPANMTALASVVFTPPGTIDVDITVPLSIELQPGSYGLVFGSGQFGATGEAVLTFNNPEIPGQASYFVNREGEWIDDSIRNTRFVVYGTVVPEPSAIALLAMACGGIALLRRPSPNEIKRSTIEKGTDRE